MHQGGDFVEERTIGDAIRDLLTSRGWTQVDLARVLNRSVSSVNEIIRGKQGLSPELAIDLAAAFGNDPAFWMTLEANRQLATIRSAGDDVRRRAALFDIAPIKDMEKRGWIRKTKSPAELEVELCRFFDVTALDETPPLEVATRRADGVDGELTPSQRAWCYRAWTMAKSLAARPFDPGSLDKCLKQLRRLAAFPQEARKVPTVLIEHGIRFVVIEPLPGSKIDGAAFWIGEMPVVALSLRYDRIDWFWFTLCHELSHVRHRDAISVDSDLTGEDREFAAAKSPVERRADNEAASTMIDPEVLESFVRRVAPMYSKQRISQFANRIKIHPGIIVGQLQHRGEIGFHANREMLVKIRDIVTPTAVTDGWGYSISTDCF